MKIFTILRYTLGSLVLIGLGSCLTEIDLAAPPTTANNLAITATLLKSSPSVLNVNVSQVDNFSGFSAPTPINNAQVFLVDEQGGGVSIPLQFEGGYRLVIPENGGSISIEEGRSYQLQVNTAEGKTYTSTFETLQPVPKASGLSYELETRESINENEDIVDQTFVRFFINTPLTADNSDKKAVLKWDMTGTYRFVESADERENIPSQKSCYVSEVLQRERPVVFNGNQSPRPVLEKQFIIEEKLDYRFVTGYYLTVRQQSISEAAFEYWESIRKVVDISGNFFEAPPGKIQSNLSNTADSEEDVFGFFSVIQEDTIRLHVSPRDIDQVILPLCPATVPAGQEPPRFICFECLLITNSTSQKPDYWIQ